jgi:hypothetical protein
MAMSGIIPIERPAPALDMMDGTLNTQALVKQVRLIQDVMAAVMKDTEHYGKLPGCEKPSLYKAGAEKLCLVFRLEPEFEIVHAVEEKEFIAFTVGCRLLHIPSGARVGSGIGSCSSRERKYAWRSGQRKCTACGATAIIKGKEEYGGGWVCFKKKGGCGAKYLDGDAGIEGQAVGEIPNPDIWDQHNTILKMAQKRALVAATLVATAASDIFTQDIEDLPEFAANGKKAESKPAPPAKAPVDRAQMIPCLRTFLAYYEYIGEQWPEMSGDKLLKQYVSLKRGGFPSLARILEFDKPKQLNWIAQVNRQLEHDFDFAGLNVNAPEPPVTAAGPEPEPALDITEDDIPL